MIAASSRVGFALSEAPIRFRHLRAGPDYNFNSRSAHWRSIRANCRTWRGGWFSTRLECAQHPVNHFAVIRLRDSIATDWLSKASETHPPASFVEADLFQKRDEARLGTKRVVVMVNLDPRQTPIAIIVGLFQQVERGHFVAEHRVYPCRLGRRNIGVC